MNPEKLLRRLAALNAATPQSLQLIAGLFVPVFFRKGMILYLPDHSFPILYYIERGLLRAYFFYQQEEYTAWLMDEGFLIPFDSFFSPAPALEYIQFLSDSEGWSLNLSKAEALAQQEPQLYRMILEIYETELRQGKQRELMLRLGTAGQRIAFAEKSYGRVLDKVLHQVLASFLNIEDKYLYKVLKKRRKLR